MKTLRRLIYGEVINAVAFVTLGFLSLFLFFDLVEEIQEVGRHGVRGYQLTHALIYVTLMIPSHLYELLPITVLIGTITVMARLAQSSEYTILRTSGLGPWQALKTLLSLGLAFVMLTFVVGDYASPLADRTAQLLKARFTGAITIGQTGAWLKERQQQSQFAVNVGELAGDGGLRSVRIFEFDAQGRVRSLTHAQAAQIQENNASWLLQEARRTQFNQSDTGLAVVRETLAEWEWPNQISTEMVSAALLKPDRMSTIGLFQYIQHLQTNAQAAQRYQIELWRKVFYPLSCLVMVVLALPFAYLHFRGGGIATYVFAGVMAGISFFLLNNVFGYIGNLRSWQPLLTAALPGLIYSMVSLTAFVWLVLRR